MTAVEIDKAHYEGCYRDHGHHDCAIAEVDRLRVAFATSLQKTMTELEALGEVLFRESLDENGRP